MSIINSFPNLVTTGYRQTSAPDAGYNCIAWAADRNDTWWEPDPMGIYYWPPNVPRRYTTEAYIQAFETVGYARGSTIKDHLEVDHEKVAIYATFDGAPRHAARQVPSGAWTSKLGQLEDIEHFLDGLVGNLYGAVVQILRRPRS